MKIIKIILIIIVAGNLFSLIQKTSTVDAFSLSVKSAETIFVNTAMIGIAVFIYLILKIKVR